MMRRSLLAAVLLAASTNVAMAQQQQADTVAWTRQAVAQRNLPQHTAPIVAPLPAGARIRLYGCQDGWCSGTAPSGTLGYLPTDSLTTTAPAPVASGKGYTNSQGQHVQSPTYSPSGPPAGATAQCRDGTYSFSASRRGTCSHHGGVSRWL